MGPYLIVFAGAGLGGMARHGLNGLGLRLFSPYLPIGTAGINVLGSFLMGLLGGFTTISLEAALLWERGRARTGPTYNIGSVGLGILALFAGLALVRAFTPA